MMKTYILKIKPISPFSTPIQADTLFGHLCWALRYLEGDEKKLLKFLEEFDSKPPILPIKSFADVSCPGACFTFFKRAP
jgi:CRISPR-associated protein Csm4